MWEIQWVHCVLNDAEHADMQYKVWVNPLFAVRLITIQLKRYLGTNTRLVAGCVVPLHTYTWSPLTKHQSQEVGP